MRSRYIDIIATGLAAGCGLAAIYLNVQLSYVVSANTESVIIKSASPVGSRWFINDAQAMTCDDDGDWWTFSGTIRIWAPTNITIERISEGPIKISIQSEPGNKGQVIAELSDFNTNTDRVAKGCLYIEIANLRERARKGETIVLPVFGYMEIGREVRFETIKHIPVLRSGKVQLVGKTFLGGSIYDAGTITLGTGELFVVEGQKAGSGLVVADQQPGLTAVSHMVGERAYVHRFGTDGYKVRSSLWVRIVKDPVISTLVASILFILGLLASWRRWMGEGQ